MKKFTILAFFLGALVLSSSLTSAYSLWSANQNASFNVLLSYASFSIKESADSTNELVNEGDIYSFNLTSAQEQELFDTGKTSSVITLTSENIGESELSQTLTLNTSNPSAISTKFYEVSSPTECLSTIVDTPNTSINFSTNSGPYSTLHEETHYVCLLINSVEGNYTTDSQAEGNATYNGEEITVTGNTSWGSDQYTLPENISVEYTPTIIP